MSYCTKCGRQINDDSGFCNSCRPVPVTTSHPTKKKDSSIIVVAIILVGAFIFLAVALHGYQKTQRDLSRRVASQSREIESARRARRGY